MKKLITLLTLLVVAVTGAWADEFILSQATATSFVEDKPSDGKAITFLSNGQTFSIAKGSTEGTAGKMGNLLKLSKNTTYTITLPENFTITAINFKGYANDADGTDVKIDKVNDNNTGWSDFPGNGVASTESSWGDFTYNVTDDKKNAGNVTFHITKKQQIGVIITITGYVTPVGLSIKTQPVSAEYIPNATATPLTVVAQGGTEPYTYQWYSCSDAEKTNPQAVGTTASYTPSTAATGYYYCKVTDSATPTPASVESNVATITISAAAAPTFTSVTPSATNVVKGTASTITAVVEGNPDPTVTWYSCDDAEKTNPVEAGTGLVLNLTNDAMGTFYYYAVASNGVSPDAESAVQTITVTGKKDCELTNIKFSNGAYGAIGTLSEGAATVTVPYLDGESDPTIIESSIVISADATYAIVGDVLTVTAEDGITKGVYTITKRAISPLTVTGDIATTTFDDVPDWAFNPYGFDAEKGVKIAKKVDEASNRRIAKGNTRMYFFIEPAVKLTLTSGTTGERNITVYRNGVKLTKPTKSAVKNESIDIELNATAPCMIMIESNQTGGDTGFTKYAVTAVSKVEVTSAEWATTTTPNYPVTFDANAKVYVVASAEGSIQLTPITEAPANTPIVVNAPAGSYTMMPADDAAAPAKNLLKSKTANDATAAVGDYALGTWIDGGNTVVGFGKLNAAGVANMTDDKAFIPASLLANAVDFLPFVIGDEESETTSIRSIENGESRIENSDCIYNLAGQKVSKDYKGIVIVNGKKVIRK